MSMALHNNRMLLNMHSRGYYPSDPNPKDPKWTVIVGFVVLGVLVIGAFLILYSWS